MLADQTHEPLLVAGVDRARPNHPLEVVRLRLTPERLRAVKVHAGHAPRPDAELARLQHRQAVLPFDVASDVLRAILVLPEPHGAPVIPHEADHEVPVLMAALRLAAFLAHVAASMLDSDPRRPAEAPHPLDVRAVDRLAL